MTSLKRDAPARGKGTLGTGTGSSRVSTWSSYLLCVLLVVLLLSDVCAPIKWLAVPTGRQRFWNKTKHCSAKRTGGLIKPQVQICKNHLELMPVVAHASKESIRVCQELFQDSRWNCSTILQTPDYTADLTGGSREQAYVYALSSAALSQAVAKACAVGATTKCGCGHLPNRAPHGDFKWGGCGDDVQYGMRFSESFADLPDRRPRKKNKKLSKKALVNIHNNGVGREIVRESLTTACKCHGVSGSCSVKTCWMALPDIRTLGASLQRRYRVAVEVKRKRKRRRKTPSVPKATRQGDESILVPVYRTMKKRVEETDLVYYTKSPDYCLPDTSLGSMGTRGRKCDEKDSGASGCKSMCCGRGYTTEVVEIRHRCDCKYYWCCYVKCKTCTKKVEINRCR